MANNRMFLVHRPTGKAVFLGKRMLTEWYGTPENLASLITELLSGIEDNDFAIAMEESNSPYVLTDWNYTAFESGIRTLNINSC